MRSHRNHLRQQGASGWPTGFWLTWMTTVFGSKLVAMPGFKEVESSLRSLPSWGLGLSSSVYMSLSHRYHLGTPFDPRTRSWGLGTSEQFSKSECFVKPDLKMCPYKIWLFSLKASKMTNILQSQKSCHIVWYGNVLLTHNDWLNEWLEIYNGPLFCYWMTIRNMGIYHDAGNRILCDDGNIHLPCAILWWPPTRHGYWMHEMLWVRMKNWVFNFI